MEVHVGKKSSISCQRWHTVKSLKLTLNSGGNIAFLSCQHIFADMCRDCTNFGNSKGLSEYRSLSCCSGAVCCTDKEKLISSEVSLCWYTFCFLEVRLIKCSLFHLCWSQRDVFFYSTEKIWRNISESVPQNNVKTEVSLIWCIVGRFQLLCFNHRWYVTCWTSKALNSSTQTIAQIWFRTR